MNLHLSTQARWRGITCLWYGKQAAFLLMVGGFLAAVWYLGRKEDTGWLVPYTLVAGITWLGLGYVIGRIRK
jgi:hypothetical protein